jgi:hypothetical protein
MTTAVTFECLGDEHLLRFAYDMYFSLRCRQRTSRRRSSTTRAYGMCLAEVAPEMFGTRP